MLADMATYPRRSRMLTWKSSAAKDTRRRAPFDSSMAKLAASDRRTNCRQAMQILSSSGLPARGSVVERLFRDVRARRFIRHVGSPSKIIAASVLATCSAESRMLSPDCRP